MNQVTKVYRYFKRREWKSIISEGSTSGMNVATWCRTNGIAICIQMDWRINKMLNIQKSILFIIKIVIASVLSGLILSGYVYLFDFSGIHIHNKTRATDYSWQANQWKSVTMEGFAWNRFDESGFNNSAVMSEIDNLIMGSSHMEAVNVQGDENVCALLNNMSCGSTYNIGMSGHTIYSCVQNICDAVEYYQPQNYLIVETGTVDLDETSMSQVLEECYPRIPSYDSGILFIIQKKVPLFKTLYKAVDSWRTSSTLDDSVEISDEKYENKKNYKQTLNRFIEKAMKPVKEKGVQLIIVYHPTVEIDCDGNIKDITNADAIISFKEACEKNNVIFLDMTNDFEKLYYDEHILTHGFINSAVGVGHLNKYGHKLIAERLAEIMEGETNDIE